MGGQCIALLTAEGNLLPSMVSGIQWRHLEQEALVEGLASLIFTKLQPIKEDVPQSSWEFFRTSYENACLFKDLGVAILKELQPALSGIGTIVLTQGMALHEAVYTEPWCRAMGDMDIFLPDGNMAAVSEVFLEYGFVPYRAYANVLVYNHIMVDLHEGLWGTDRFKEREALVPRTEIKWRSSDMVPGLQALVPESLALHCAYHAIKHGFQKAVWEFDLLQMYRAGHLTGTATNPQEYAVKYIVFEVLRRHGVCVPDKKNEPLSEIGALKKKIVRFLVRKKPSAGTGQLLLGLVAPSMQPMVRYFIAVLVPPRRILQEMYGVAWYPLLVIKRIGTICFYAGRALCVWK